MQFGDAYRKYYVDHPTSSNHHDQYLIPLHNQYSILNKSRNPYAALDHFSADIHARNDANSSMARALQKESLDVELKSWERKQQERENEIRLARSEVHELEGIARLKDLEQELNTLSFARKAQPQTPAILPFPMFMPMLSPQGGGCCCQCNCRCQHAPQKRYKPVATENCAVETDPEPVTNLTKVQSVRSVKTVNSTAQKIPSEKPTPAVRARMPVARRKALLRKFRVCSIAVYFAIYFKWFSFQFSLNRYNNFKAKYLMDSGKAITENYRQVYAELLKVDILGVLADAAEKVPAPPATSRQKQPADQFDIATLLKNESAAKLKKLGELRVLSRDKETLMLRCAQAAVGLLGAVQRAIGEWEWGQVGYGLGVGCLNQSFVIDNVFLPHEIYLMEFHDGKGYARVGAEGERVLTMTKFIIKLLLFNVCLQLDNNKEWFEANEEALRERQDLEELFILLEVTAKLLFIFCQNMYEASLQDRDPNYQEVESKFQIEPCNPLVYSHSIRRRRELFKQEDIRDSNLLIYGIERLDEVNELIVQPFFKQAHKRVAAQLGRTVDALHAKLALFNRQHYQQIWEETLADEYIVLRGLKKIMRSNRYYPYASASVLASRSNLPSSLTLSKKTLQRESKKTLERDSIKEDTISSKISLENVIRRNRK